ncbi:hypothetical protein HELRODRAFT_93424, partial [Helobdella robusta]|uniref:Histone H4 n=1 Tax=Helobdella robusta TaxID=6412 RepID=T1G8V8_HELRO
MNSKVIMNGQSSEDEPNKMSGNNFVISNDSVKVISETVGISNLDETGLSILSERTTFVLKLILGDSKQFMEKNNRLKLTSDDIDLAMRNRGIEPVFGFYTGEPIPFRMASGGSGREIFFDDEKEVDLNDIISAPPPKVPLECTIKPHWLAIEGIQPLIPENPAPITKKVSSEQGTLNIIGSQKAAESVLNKSKIKLNTVEKVRIKEVTTHELSIEQQLYLKEITEACVGSDENRRIEALNSLMTDTGLFQMLPRLCNFISEGVRINTVQNNLALLIYLMRMTKSLVDNQSLSLEKYLHELIPPIFSCIISRQLCIRPDSDNHWALRDFAARLICQVCKNFNTSTNQLQSRITKMLSTTLQNESAPLATHYGAIICLGELGQEVVKAFVLPHLVQISEKLASVLENSLGMLIISNIDRIAAEHIKTAVLKIVPPVLRQVKNSPDSVEEYKQDHGLYLGPLLHSAVLKLR